MNAPNTNTGEPTGNPNPASGQQAPANQPGTQAQGTGQTPSVGGNPQQPQGTPAAQGSPTPAVPLDRRGQQTPTPGASGDTVPLKALQEEREKRQTLQQQNEELTRYVQSIQQQQPNAGTTYPQAGSQAPQQPNAGDRAHIDKLWETDPKQAVRAEINQAVSYYDTVNAQVEAQANYLAQSHPDFNNYRTTAMNYIRTLPYDQRAQPGIVELAYMVARGQSVDTLLQTKEQELMEKFKTGQLAGALHHPAGATGASTFPTGEVNLTPEQAAAADAMGLSHQDYIANMKRTGAA